jgi:hypothetical protein
MQRNARCEHWQGEVCCHLNMQGRRATHAGNTGMQWQAARKQVPHSPRELGPSMAMVVNCPSSSIGLSEAMKAAAGSGLWVVDSPSAYPSLRAGRRMGRQVRGGRGGQQM